jgi:hypothetical protein
VISESIGVVSIAERRDRALHLLAQVVALEMPPDADGCGSFAPSSQLTAELIVGGVFRAIRASIIEHPSRQLAGLAPSLTAFIVAPFQPAAGRPEPNEPEAERDERPSASERLPVRATYRTTRVLNAIAAAPRLSNREIADAAGLSDEGQTSKLLRRLEHRGLVENVGLGQAYGEANAWLLTAYGERMLEATRHSLTPGAGAVRGRRVRGAA